MEYEIKFTVKYTGSEWRLDADDVDDVTGHTYFFANMSMVKSKIDDVLTDMDDYIAWTEVDDE